VYDEHYLSGRQPLPCHATDWMVLATVDVRVATYGCADVPGRHVGRVDRA
jgi:hypothetical protein